MTRRPSAVPIPPVLPAVSLLRRAPVGAAALLTLALAGCASLPPGGAAPSGGAGAAAPTRAAAAPAASPSAAAGAASAPGTAAAPGAAPGPAARPDAAAPRPFADVIRGATQLTGFVPVWRKDDKLWLEIAPERFDQPFLLSVNIASSVGERGLYGSQMGPNWLATFRKINNTQVQLIALNTGFVAGNAPMQATVEQSFSHSLLGSAAIASAPHPERKTVLIDAGFLLGDIAGYSTQLESAFRLPFGLDRGNSFFEKVRVTEDLTTVGTRVHFATPRIPAAPATPPPPGATPPSPPTTTPDPRSFFVGFVYSFTQLSATPMPVRKPDPRLGHFTDVVTDYSNDLKVVPRQHFISRWRLEKADPAAELSTPKQPIVFWLDRNIPVAYREAVREGVLEWNKAFERIGFKDAIVAKQQPDDADWDTLDGRHASIRWFVGADVGFARGPNHSDPRTGEIIDADIAMSDVFGRSARRFVVENVGPTSKPFATPLQLPGMKPGQLCTYADDVATELDMALGLLEARGEIAPESPEAEAFVRSVIKDTITHEVGHTLGLKHNFKASTVYRREQLRDRGFTEQYGVSASVMDYNALNIAAAGEVQTGFNNRSIGPYDYWAIEYAYKPLDAANEAQELERIAARVSTDPLLAYADDADAGGFGGNDGIDPLANRFDLGDDPLAYYRKRLQLSRELWQRVQTRDPSADEDPTRQRRVLLAGFAALRDSPALVAKYVGGMVTSRDKPGRGQPAYRPVDPAKQREALAFLADGLFNADSFRFQPQFLASLSPDYNEWNRSGPVSIPQAVLQLQTSALDRLMSAGTATRLLDLPLFVPDARPGEVITLAEVYRTLQDAVWSELKSGAEIDRLRRNLQREHLRRVQGLLVRGGAGLPPDALSLARLHATQLEAELKRAVAAPTGKRSIETRAHLQDSLALLTEALRASMVRS